MRGSYNVLFLSRRNSARGLIAEAVVNRHGKGKFLGFSAGVEPPGAAEPLAMEVLHLAGYVTDGLQPKHWNDFAQPDSPAFDFVFTLSHTASGETLPEWRGRPISAQWHYPDPVKGALADWQKRQAFNDILKGLERQLQIFLQLPFPSLDRIALRKRIDEIGTAEQRDSAA